MINDEQFSRSSAVQIGGSPKRSEWSAHSYPGDQRGTAKYAEDYNSSGRTSTNEFRKSSKAVYGPWTTSGKGMPNPSHQNPLASYKDNAAAVSYGGSISTGLPPTSPASDSSPPSLSSLPSTPSPSLPATPSQAPFSPSSLPGSFTTQSLLAHLELDQETHSGSYSEDSHSHSHSHSQKNQQQQRQNVASNTSARKDIESAVAGLPGVSNNVAGLRPFPEFIDFSPQILPAAEVQSSHKPTTGANAAASLSESRLSEEISFLRGILESISHSSAARGSNESASENWLGLGSCSDQEQMVGDTHAHAKDIGKDCHSASRLGGVQQEAGMAAEPVRREGDKSDSNVDDYEKFLCAYQEMRDPSALGMPSLASPPAGGVWNLTTSSSSAPDSSLLGQFGSSSTGLHVSMGGQKIENDSDAIFNSETTFWELSVGDDQLPAANMDTNAYGFNPIPSSNSHAQFALDGSRLYANGTVKTESDDLQRQQMPVEHTPTTDAASETVPGSQLLPGVTSPLASSAVSTTTPDVAAGAPAASMAVAASTPNSSMSSSSCDEPDDDTATQTGATGSSVTSTSKRKTSELDTEGDDKPTIASGSASASPDAKKAQQQAKRKKGPKNPRPREPRFAIQTRSEVEIMDDSYRWRKYGQKAVKNSPHPRSYYRCTNNKCPVRKRVERSSDDHGLVITTYEGTHNHISPASRPSADAYHGHTDPRNLGIQPFFTQASPYSFARPPVSPSASAFRSSFDLQMQMHGGGHGQSSILPRYAPRSGGPGDFMGGHPGSPLIRSSLQPLPDHQQLQQHSLSTGSPCSPADTFGRFQDQPSSFGQIHDIQERLQRIQHLQQQETATRMRIAMNNSALQQQKPLMGGGGASSGHGHDNGLLEDMFRTNRKL